MTTTSLASSSCRGPICRKTPARTWALPKNSPSLASCRSLWTSCPSIPIDPKKFTDRPYWSYESKFIAGTAIATADPHLYGLVLTNFGCGPNSFILRILEDITGNKPLGQLEIDEHAAEAGLVTRLEAFVDTIQGHARAARQELDGRTVYRGTSSLARSKKTILISASARLSKSWPPLWKPTASGR